MSPVLRQHGAPTQNRRSQSCWHAMKTRKTYPSRNRSIWVFLLLGIEAIRTYKTNPHLTIGTHNIPTWTMPLILALCIAALVPSSSLLGHLCGLVVGYICEFHSRSQLFYSAILSSLAKVVLWRMPLMLIVFFPQLGWVISSSWPRRRRCFAGLRAS